MKSAKDFITERLDELALEYHDKFYCDLTKELQETIWSMAHKDYVGCWPIKVWACPKCDKVNSTKQTHCLRCGSLRPDTI